MKKKKIQLNKRQLAKTSQKPSEVKQNKSVIEQLFDVNHRVEEHYQLHVKQPLGGALLSID